MTRLTRLSILAALKTAGFLCFTLIFSGLVVAMVVTSAQVILP